MLTDQKFVPDGTSLRCSKGTLIPKLIVTSKNVLLYGKHMATEFDKKPFANIPSFGSCTVTQYCPPCTPVPIAWKEFCEDDVYASNGRPLLEDSTLKCSVGGEITIILIMPTFAQGAVHLWSAAAAAQGIADKIEDYQDKLSDVGEISSKIELGLNIATVVLAVGGVLCLLSGPAGIAAAITMELWAYRTYRASKATKTIKKVIKTVSTIAKVAPFALRQSSQFMQSAGNAVFESTATNTLGLATSLAGTALSDLTGTNTNTNNSNQSTQPKTGKTPTGTNLVIYKATPCTLLGLATGNQPGGFQARLDMIELVRNSLSKLPEAERDRLSEILQNYERLNKATEHAKLSTAVYDEAPLKTVAPDWIELNANEARALGVTPDMLRDDVCGFKAKIYRSNAAIGKYVIAYQGTNMTSWVDWGTNGEQGLGLSTKQYTKAITLAETVAKKVGVTNLELTGHSLGGGMASAGSAHTGAKATILNSAGLNKKTATREGTSDHEFESRKKNVTAISNSTDPLNTAQNNREEILGSLAAIGHLAGQGAGFLNASLEGGFKEGIKQGDEMGSEIGDFIIDLVREGALPRAYGQKKYIIETSDINGHGIENMVKALEKEKEKLFEEFKKLFKCT